MRLYRKWISRILQTAAAVFLMAGMYFFSRPQTQVLEFGMFTGSNWGVENADAFVIIDRAIQRFEKSHPGIEVRYTSGIEKKDYSEWCAKRILEGKMPDVFMVLDTDFNQYCSLGILQELNSFMESDPEFQSEEIFRTAMDIGKGTEEIQYALPYEIVPTMLFVNKTLLQQEGIEMPQQDWTWDDFMEICRKVTKDTDGDGRIDQFGTYNYSWQDAMYTSGGSAFDNEKQNVDFSNQYVIESVKFMKELLALNQGENVTQEDFDAGKVAFMPLTFAEYRTYKTYPYKIKKYSNFQWDCTTFPGRTHGENISKVDALLIGINHDSTEKELAWEFLKELVCGYESQLDIFRYSQGVSVLESVARSEKAASIIQEDMDKEEQVISGELLCDVIEHGTITPKFYQYETYEQMISLANTEITEIFEQNKNIESSMKIFQREIRKYLNQ
ncbi:ABC transporter substrate-binding protein [Drancourtella sp. An57]|uniref:ABC transporter substrate-binding protein n=1 Tax=Drancourtella sp. An57 TaxID=1965647 RepID=UPI000B36552E|nr:extracellular solute-binding protein [Drancourtella sp. An57]OUN70148.1 ABC transporter substrate-binding protein [Drancourtella sp. An57]